MSDKIGGISLDEIMNAATEDLRKSEVKDNGPKDVPKDVHKEEKKYCRECGAEVDDRFCPDCGTPIDGQAKSQTGDEPKTTKSTGGFIGSLKEDVGNSKSLKVAKAKVKTIANDVEKSKIGKKFNLKILIPIAAVAMVVVVILALVFGFHECEECGKKYFGKSNEISFFGMESSVCDDCYGDFYGGWF